MKVPYLNKKISAEFALYLGELEQSVGAHVQKARADPFPDLYASLFPLFVLLRSLSAAEYVRDPSRDTVLQELKDRQNKDEFLRAVSFFNKRHPYQSILNAGLQKQVFTGYFQELFSDTLLLLNSYYLCNYRGSFIALRCMLEDLYRHFYYRDHPEEFWAIRSRTKSEYDLGVKPAFLREYLARTSYLSGFGKLNIDFLPRPANDSSLLDLNEALYFRCSAAVHGSEDSAHNSFTSNLDLQFDQQKSDEVTREVKRFSEMAVAFLSAAHADQLLGLNEYEKSIIFSRFSEARRGALRSFLNL